MQIQSFIVTHPLDQYAAARVIETTRDAASNLIEALPSNDFAIEIKDTSDLTKVPGPALVALYNRARPTAPVKKFENKVVAARRVYEVLGDVAEKPGPSKKSEVVSDGTASVKGKRLGIGVLMAGLLREGKDTNEVLRQVREKFPASRATAGDVSIIRRKVKNNLI